MTEEKKLSYKQFREKFKDLAALREKVANRASNKNSKKRDNSEFYEMLYSWWKPNKISMPVVIGRDEYENWQVTIKDESTGRYSTATCNCHNGQRDVPCVVCYYAMVEENNNLLPKRKNARTVTLWDYFHVEEKQAASGNTYKKWARCDGEDHRGRVICAACKADVPRVFGRRVYWNLGWGHLQQLNTIMEGVSHKCSSCEDGMLADENGVPHVSKFTCPECKSTIVDLDEVALDKDEMDEYLTKETVCPHCEATVKAEYETMCLKKNKKGKWVPGCDNPKHTDPHECVLWLSTTGEGASTALVLDGFEPINLDEVPESYDPKVREPLPFEMLLGRSPLFVQAKAINRANPFTKEDEKLVTDYLKNKERVSSDKEDEYSAPR